MSPHWVPTRGAWLSSIPYAHQVFIYTLSRCSWAFFRLSTSSSLSLFLHVHQLPGPLQNSLEFIHVSHVLGNLDMNCQDCIPDASLQCWAERKDNLLQPAGNAFSQRNYIYFWDTLLQKHITSSCLSCHPHWPQVSFLQTCLLAPRPLSMQWCMDWLLSKLIA